MPLRADKNFDNIQADMDSPDQAVIKKPQNVWGQVHTSPRLQPESLKDVMSEQLINKLREEQDSLKAEQLLMDAALAESLQRQFDGAAEENSADTNSASLDSTGAVAISTSVDSDLEFAKLLQQQFNSEYNRELELSEQRINQGQKIRVTLSGHRVPALVQSPSDPPPVSADPPDADDSGEDSDASPSDSRGRQPCNRRPRGPCPPVAMVTKHDSEVTGRRNAERMATRFGLGFREGDTSKLPDLRLDNRVYNGLRRHAEAADRRGGARLKDKRDHGTAELALDEATRRLLFKQVSAGRFSGIGGVVATGKESVVLHAYCDESSCTPSGKPMPPEAAIKVFKTTLNEFKSRSEYVTGDFRVSRDPLSWQNPRKVMRVWCEKELLNLRRMRKLGLPCPTPLMLNGHVLAMSFIGESGRAAPRLKDCRLEPEEWATAWEQVSDLLSRLYKDCGLVHADFSEYNLLWWRQAVWVIDVSQSVESGHPRALHFLLRDCRRVLQFFAGRCPGDLPSLSQLFNRITGLGILSNDEEEDDEEGFCESLDRFCDTRAGFEGDRVHMEHGIERREFQFDRFFEQPADEAGAGGSCDEGEEEWKEGEEE